MKGKGKKMEEEGRYPLFPAWSNVRDMLRDRGYLVPPNPSLQEYVQDYCDEQGLEVRDRLSLAFSHSSVRGGNTGQIRVLFIGIDKVGKGELETILKRLGETSVRAVLILPANATVTPTARKIIANLSEPVQIEVFRESEMTINVVRNSGLSFAVFAKGGTEQERLVHKYGGKFGSIAVDDMTARYYGLRPGDILQSTRRSETAGYYATYKLCRYVEELPKETPNKKKKVA